MALYRWTPSTPRLPETTVMFHASYHFLSQTVASGGCPSLPLLAILPSYGTPILNRVYFYLYTPCTRQTSTFLRSESLVEIPLPLPQAWSLLRCATSPGRTHPDGDRTSPLTTCLLEELDRTSLPLQTCINDTRREGRGREN